MIYFKIRTTDASSLNLFRNCFSNKEFSRMLYDDAPVNITKYIESNVDDIKYTLSFRYSNDATYVDLGFANCYKKNDGTYTYVGGIDPCYFNSGIGVKANIAMISYIYSKHPNIVLTTGIYKYNIRSIKMNEAIGFKKTGTTESKILYGIKKSDFDNIFVRKILENIVYE